MFFKPKKKQAAIYIPTWEEVIEHCYDQDLTGFSDSVVKVIYNYAKSYRVLILLRRDGYYQIREEKLTACDKDELNFHPDIWGYWMQIERYVSVFDSLDSAVEEALRLIKY